MPVFNFLVVAGLALIALLFVADATLEPGSPVIVTSQRIGLPAPQYENAIKTLNTAPAPAPDMTSRPVLAAQPNSARAKVKREHNRVTRPFDYRQNRWGDTFSFWGR